MITTPSLELSLVDVTALADSTATATDKQSFVDLNDLKTDFDTENYNTLENDQWKLNGTFKLFPAIPTDYSWGYWSLSQSDSLGDFSSHPTLTITFGTTHTTNGITFEFWSYENDYAKDITIAWYNASNALIIQKDFVCNDRVFLAKEKVTNFKKIIIQFKSTNLPYRFIKLKKIYYGELILLDEKSIKTLNIIEDMDLTSNQLTINSLSSEIFVSSVARMQEIYELLQETQQLICNMYVNNVKNPMGTFYVRDKKLLTETTLQLEAEDIVGLLSDKTFFGGIYSGITFETLISNIMTDFGTDKYVIADNLKSRTLSGYIPVCSHREALQMAAFAVNAVVDCKRSNIINIFEVSSASTVEIDKGACFSYTEEDMDKMGSPVTGVTLTIVRYDTSGGSASDLYEVNHSAGTYTCLLKEPATSFSITGGTIVESDANYITFTATGGTVKITGIKYEKSQQIEVLNRTDLPSNISPNIIDFENTLVWDIAANVQHIFDYEIFKSKVELDKILGAEMVSNYIELTGFFSKTFNGYITSCDIDLSGGFRAKVVANGNMS